MGEAEHMVLFSMGGRAVEVARVDVETHLAFAERNQGGRSRALGW